MDSDSSIEVISPPVTKLKKRRRRLWSILHKEWSDSKSSSDEILPDITDMTDMHQTDKQQQGHASGNGSGIVN